jgi:hypothetical protein
MLDVYNPAVVAVFYVRVVWRTSAFPCLSVRGHVAWTPFSKTMSMYLLNVRVRAHAAEYVLSWHENPFFRVEWLFLLPLSSYLAKKFRPPDK